MNFPKGQETLKAYFMIRRLRIPAGFFVDEFEQFGHFGHRNVWVFLPERVLQVSNIDCAVLVDVQSVVQSSQSANKIVKMIILRC